MKTAIVNCPDSGPVESLVVMLRSVGYRCHVPDAALSAELKKLGGLVLTNDYLVKAMGYEPHMPISSASPAMMREADLYVDIKAHQTYPRLVERWPNLMGKVLWYRIQGGKPEHVIRRNDDGSVKEDCGDEVNPPCPVLTPNQWYYDLVKCGQCGDVEIEPDMWHSCGGEFLRHQPFYTCWPPFHRFHDYAGDRSNKYGPPICLIHNVEGWGYRDLIPSVRSLGVRIFGRGSPDGLLDHRTVPTLLKSCLAYVHLKSSDAPGYALYEALASGCPVVCTRRLIWRCKMQDLLVPGKTCLVFDRETHDGLTPDDVMGCLQEVYGHLEWLRNPEFNREIGLAGRDQLQKVMWSDQRPKDVDSLRQFMERNFGH